MHPLLKRGLVALAATATTAVVYVLVSGSSTIEAATDLLPAVVVGAIVFMLPALNRKESSAS